MSTDDSKSITEIEYPDGRKDVHIHVKTLDVDLSDPSNIEAKRVIEEQVLPALANKKMVVTVIHKPTNDHFSFIANVPKVREYSLQLIAEREDKTLEHYCVVQHDFDDHTVTVTSL